MNTIYVAEYSPPSRPKMVKRLVASSGETLEVEVPYTNKQEVDQITTEIIFTHTRNLVQYIKDLSPSIFITEKDDEDIEPWPIKNWQKIELAKNEASYWWEIGYYRDEPEEEEELSDV